MGTNWAQTEHGWDHADGGAVRPSDEVEGRWQLWGPTVGFRGPGGMAKLKQPHEDPQHLMDWYSWASGEGPKPKGVGFWGSIHSGQLKSGPWLLEASEHLRVPMDEMSQYAVWGIPDHDSPFEGLGEHIRTHGIQEPLTVATDGQRAYLQDGYHRWEEAQNAGLSHLPVNVEHVHPRAIDDQGAGGVELGPALHDYLHGGRTASGWFLAIYHQDPTPHTYLPTDEVHNYRQYDVTPDENRWGAPMSEPYQGGNLLTDMAHRGQILQPVDIDTNGKWATLSDGHHRLAAARRLGMTHVPAHINWRTEPGWGDHPGDRLAHAGPALRDWVDKNSPADLEALRG